MGLRRQVLQRRLRILTVPLAVARSARDLYAHADADAVLVLLAHKAAVRCPMPPETWALWRALLGC